jgi:hypothetical protein
VISFPTYSFFFTCPPLLDVAICCVECGVSPSGRGKCVWTIVGEAVCVEAESTPVMSQIFDGFVPVVNPF